jgi:GT2 family glycosyltransferase
MPAPDRGYRPATVADSATSLRAPAEPAEGWDPRVSVVVITRNRVRELLTTLAHLTVLRSRPRIVVVDNASTDGTVAAVRRAFPDVELVALARNRGGAARNVGTARVTTPYVAFADDDSWWAPGSLERAADLLDGHPRLALVNAHILVNDEQRDDPICLEMAQSPLPRAPGQPGHALLSFIGCAVVMRRSAFLEVGGYRDDLVVGGEEEVLGWDLATAGWHMSYVPELIAHHHPSLQRDAHERRARGIRNTLWTTWLRRPLRPACRRTWRLLRSLPRDRVTARGLAAAAAGLPRILLNRRVSPPHVERLRRLLDEQQERSEARRYTS